MNDPVFIGGCERSGTTLLRVLLDTHPNIHCGPEAKIVAKTIPSWIHQRNVNTNVLRDYYHFTDSTIDVLYRNIILTAISRGHTLKTTWIAEKSPQNVFYYEHIRTLFPDSLIVNVIRDGRDVVASLLEMDWNDSRGKRLDFTVDITAACRRWLTAINAASTFSRGRHASPYLQIRYEDLVTRPQTTLTPLLDLLGEPWEERLLDYHEVDRELGEESSAVHVQHSIGADRIGRWKNKFNCAEISIINSYLHETLVKLGYAETGTPL